MDAGARGLEARRRRPGTRVAGSRVRLVHAQYSPTLRTPQETCRRRPTHPKPPGPHDDPQGPTPHTDFPTHSTPPLRGSNTVLPQHRGSPHTDFPHPDLQHTGSRDADSKPHSTPQPLNRHTGFSTTTLRDNTQTLETLHRTLQGERTTREEIVIA